MRLQSTPVVTLALMATRSIAVSALLAVRIVDFIPVIMAARMAAPIAPAMRTSAIPIPDSGEEGGLPLGLLLQFRNLDRKLAPTSSIFPRKGSC